jgi:hypothetical protein
MRSRLPAAPPRLPRRFFLGGLAVAVSLPPFESLLGKQARAQGPQPPDRRQRMLTFFLPDGALMDEWIPTATTPGGGLALPPLLAPMAGLEKKLLVVSGLSNLPGKPDDGTGDHACGTAAAFTAAAPRRGDGALIKNGVSVDQAALGVLRKNTRIASLQIGLEDGATSGDCEFGFSCVYENCISWASDTQALPKSTSPAGVFDQLFAGFDPAASAQARAERRARRTSVLDYVRGETTALSSKLARSDRAKLDQVLTGVRELEKQVQHDATGGAPVCEGATRPPPPVDVPMRAQLMNRLVELAFRCDVTRVVSHMLGHAFPSRAYSFIGVNAKHHDASHYFDEAAKDGYRKIILWHMGMVADLLRRLDAIPDGAGSVLDNTMVILTSDCGEARGHDHNDLPMLLAGGAGVLRMGRHLAFPSSQTVGNLYLSILRALGVPANGFGVDGKASLPGLT